MFHFSFQLIFLVPISIPISQVLLFHLLCGGGMINFQNCGYSYGVSQRLLSCRRETKNFHSTAANLPWGCCTSLFTRWELISEHQDVLHVGPFLAPGAFSWVSLQLSCPGNFSPFSPSLRRFIFSLINPFIFKMDCLLILAGLG